MSYFLFKLFLKILNGNFWRGDGGEKEVYVWIGEL